MTFMAKSTRTETLAAILDRTLKGVTRLYGQMEWAEDELSHAIRRHPSEADALFHGFHLLAPTHDLMTTDFVYRSHCRELLGRIVAGADTRPGTAAEACCALRDCSVRASLSSPAAGLYLRMWCEAFPEQPMFADSLPYHEMLEGSVIDTLEAATRLKLTVKNRKLRTIECSGRHNGRTVQCRFVTAYHCGGTTGPQLVLPGSRDGAA